MIDFKNPENNHFLAVKEMKIHSQLYRRRTDIVGFVNGIPLLFIELKKPTVDVQNAYIDNYRNYLDTIPQLFYYMPSLCCPMDWKPRWARLAASTSSSASGSV